VSADLGMIFGSIKIMVVEQLQALYGELYTRDNVMLSGIHTHSGPQGFSWHTLYNVAGILLLCLISYFKISLIHFI
jgi:neutral ceramidase